MQIREHTERGFYVEGATKKVVKSPAQCLAALQAGTKARVTGETKMNVASSRSHAVFTLAIEHSDVFVEGMICATRCVRVLQVRSLNTL